MSKKATVKIYGRFTVWSQARGQLQMKKLPRRETELFVQDTCPVSGGLKTSTPVSAHLHD